MNIEFNWSLAVMFGIFMLFLGYIGTNYSSLPSYLSIKSGALIIMIIMFFIGFFIGGYEKSI